MAIHPTRAGNVKVPYLVEKVVDFAVTAATASATVVAVPTPAESIILAAGFEKTTAMTGSSTDVTLTARVDSTAYTTAMDYDAAAVGDYAVSTAVTPVVKAAADSVDLLLNGFTGTITGGKVRVWALVLDVSDAAKPGIAQLKS